MSVLCTNSPTLTQTSQVVTQTLEITSTDSVTTTPPTTSTTVVVTTSCATLTLSGTEPCVTTSITSTTIIPAVTATVQVPLTLTVPITSNVFATLFGSSCTTISTDPIIITIPPTSQLTTPSPTVITSESTSTQDNGSVIVQTMTTTATYAPVPVPTTVQPTSNSNTGPIQIAPIIGGAVGGFFGLLGIVALIWFILKRRRRWDDIFEKEDHDLAASIGPRRDIRFPVDADVGPKPYHYGLVGHALSPDPLTPPHSPTLPSVLHTTSNSYGPQSRHERRRSSLTPLNLPMSASTPGPSATTSSRPSTGGSTQPLRPPSQHGQQQQQRPADFGRSRSASAISQYHQQGASSFSNRSASPDRGTGYGAGTSTIGMAVLAGYDQPSYPNRTGSPASMEEQPTQRLTVVNASSPESLTFPSRDPSDTTPAAAAATAVPLRDGQGGLRTIPPKAPIIHLDGGRVQGRIPNPRDTSGSSSVAAPTNPPAYEA